MTLLERVEEKYIEYDRRARASLRNGYDTKAADMRDLLDDIKEALSQKEKQA